MLTKRPAIAAIMALQANDKVIHCGLISMVVVRAGQSGNASRATHLALFYAGSGTAAGNTGSALATAGALMRNQAT